MYFELGPVSNPTISRRNVVVDSFRQKRQRMLYVERDDVLLPFEKRFRETRAKYHEWVQEMHINHMLQVFK